MLDRSAHKPVRNAGKRAGRDELCGGQQLAIRPRGDHALIDVPLRANALCIFQGAKLDRNAHANPEQRGEGSLDIKRSHHNA